MSGTLISSSITNTLYIFAKCLWLMFAAAVISFNVLGVFISLQAAYTHAATSPDTVLPRVNPLFLAFLYIYAAFSTIASGNASLSFIISSSLKAWIKLISEEEVLIRALESHVLNLCIVVCIAAFIILPVASLFVLPMTVESPIS